MLVTFIYTFINFSDFDEQKRTAFWQKNVNQQKCFFNIDNKEKCYLNTKLAY